MTFTKLLIIKQNKALQSIVLSKFQVNFGRLLDIAVKLRNDEPRNSTYVHIIAVATGTLPM